MSIPANQLLPRAPNIKDDGTFSDSREAQIFFQRLQILLGIVSGSTAFNVPDAILTGTNNGGTTGATTTANGTVELYINGTKYYLLKAATA